MKITAAILKKISPTAKKAVIGDLELYLAPTLEKYGINTQLRVAHFLAQAAHESAHFQTLKEFWGPTAAQKRYEGRKDLGNTVEGDGKRFMGRGIFQITGRANYTDMGKRLGIDLVTDPNVAATGKISVLTACEYWKSRNINVPADSDDVTAVTKKINGGTNGLQERINYLKTVKGIIHEIFSEPTPPLPEHDKPVVVAPEPDESDNALLMRGSNNDLVKLLQIGLTNNGYPVNNDGDFGQATENAVKAYQKANKLKVNGYVTMELYLRLIKV